MSSIDAEPRYLTGAKAAAHAGIHPSTLYKWIADGKVRAAKFCGIWYVRVEDLDRLMPTTANLDALLDGEPR
jgi:excisionase family DNA binding protein